MPRPSFRTQVAVCVCWLLLPLAGCVREHSLLEAAAAGQLGGVDDAGAAGQGQAGSSGGVVGGGGNAGVLTPPWTQSSCVSSLASGKTGDRCMETFKCTATVDCCEIIAFCDGKALDIANNCSVCPMKCSADLDCGANALCENYQCRSCPTDPCPDTWSAVLRNGCSVCMPPNQCKIDGDPICGALSCVPGLSCWPGCKSDPACCFGNRCVDPNCASLEALDCLVVGCAAGSFCKVNGPANECKCEPSSGNFVCSGNSNNTCVAF